MPDYQGEPIDKLLRKLDEVSRRMDALEEEEARRDAGESCDDPPDDYYDRRDRRRHDSISIRVSDGMSAADEARALEFRSRADSLYQTIGARAPRPEVDYETLVDYRRRLLRPLMQYTSHPGLDVRQIPASSLTAFEAIAEREVPATINARTDATDLRQVSRTMPSGHHITTWYGRPHHWMHKFACPPRRAIFGRPVFENNELVSWERA